MDFEIIQKNFKKKNKGIQNYNINPPVELWLNNLPFEL
jgi:hypothetical protein